MKILLTPKRRNQETESQTDVRLKCDNLLDKHRLHNSELTIEVIDQGKGFSAKILRHAKEQFYMGDESRTKSGHNGLGLYIADNIIRKHRGHITLSNSKNGGAMVTIKIPIH